MEEGYVDLFVYEPGRDRFTKISTNIPEPFLIGYAGSEKNEAVCVYSSVAGVVKKDEDDNGVCIRAFESAAVFTVKKNSINNKCQRKYRNGRNDFCQLESNV